MSVFTSLIDGGSSGNSDRLFSHNIRCVPSGFVKTINGGTISISSTAGGYCSVCNESKDTFYFFNGSGIKVIKAITGEISTIDPPDESVYFQNGSMAYVNGEIHLLGGDYYQSESCTTTHYVYRSGSWTKLSDLPQKCYKTSALGHDGELYYVGLTVTSIGQSMGRSCTVYRYNGDSDTWSQLGSSFPGTVGEPILFTVGGSLMLMADCTDASEIYYHEGFIYENGDWRYIGRQNQFSRNGYASGELSSGYIIASGCTIYGSKDKINWERLPGLSMDYSDSTRMACLGVGSDGLLYYAGASGVKAIAETYRLQLPGGAVIYSNDGELAAINGKKILTKDTSIHVMNKPDNYLTVMVGDNLVLMEADIVNHRVYALKGMIINGQKVTQDGLITIPDLGNRLVVNY